jgi:hypothetical protein
MNQKDKALKTALTAVGVLAVAMFAYYWINWHLLRKTENDVNFNEKAEVQTPDDKAAAAFAGVYSAADPIEGNNKRLAFFSLNRREDGSGYFGTAKVDPIGSETEASAFLQCNSVTIGDKDFFVKCEDKDLGEISYAGEWTKANGGIQVNGKILWSKNGTEITNKATTLTRTGN